MPQLRRPTAALLQSLDDGLVGLYADLHLRPRCLVGCARQRGLGLLQVGLGRLLKKNKTKNKTYNQRGEKSNGPRCNRTGIFFRFQEDEEVVLGKLSHYYRGRRRAQGFCALPLSCESFICHRSD